MVSSVRRAIMVLLIVLALGMASCGGDRNAPAVLLEGDEAALTTNPLVGAIAEVSPPERIQQLKPFLDVYEPQVRIASPRDNALLDDTTVAVQLQVRDLPIYKDADLGFGPHVHVFLDDQPYQSVYDATESLVLTDLAPGTHTLRALAVRPWNESFKNEGAYDQVTFNVFTTSPNNDPDDSQLLLTYGSPQGSYGAEPILLDFYLKNAPLHIVAENDEAIADWRLRCTVNGESFVFDRWQPIYLKGFRPGKNWIKLEAIDENGSLIENVFNTGTRVLDYTPGDEDGLSQLIRGEIPLSQAKVLVDPSYVPPAPAEAVPPIEAASEDALPEAEIPAVPAELIPAPAPDSPALTDDAETPEEETEEPPAEAQLEPESAVLEEADEIEQPSLKISAPENTESDINAEANQFDSPVPEPEAEEALGVDALENSEDMPEALDALDEAQASDSFEDSVIAPDLEDETVTDVPEIPSSEATADRLEQPSALPPAATEENFESSAEDSEAIELEQGDPQPRTEPDLPASGSDKYDPDAAIGDEDAPAPNNSTAEFDFI